jgi:pimeloyl-ACP methyl ester carboxylesterase
MMGAVAPNSPPAYQREATWLYGQGGPGIFAGDGFSYGHEFDLTEEQARQIDTSKVDVYMLTGEYDRFARSGGTERLTHCIAGSKYILIDAAGHFAPSDNPVAFKRALDPVLREISAKWR